MGFGESDAKVSDFLGQDLLDFKGLAVLSSKIGDLPMKYKRLKFDAFNPQDDQVAEFLSLVSDPANHPAFVHCKHGSDRTGMMCAIYRVAMEGWSKDRAIDEWTKGGFGFHGMFENLVEYFDELDIKSLAPPQPAG